MNQRTQTTLIAVAMLIVTISVAAHVFDYLNVNNFSLIVKNSAVAALIFWLYTGSPSVVSLALAMRLKYDIPINVLRVSTIIYALWYAYGLYQIFDHPAGGHLFLLYSGIVLMLPATTIILVYTLVLDRHYAKQSLLEFKDSVE